MEGEQPYLVDLLTMVLNHLLTGMIQVGGHVDLLNDLSEQRERNPCNISLYTLVYRDHYFGQLKYRNICGV